VNGRMKSKWGSFPKNDSLRKIAQKAAGDISSPVARDCKLREGSILSSLLGAGIRRFGPITGRPGKARPRRLFDLGGQKAPFLAQKKRKIRTTAEGIRKG